MPNYVKNIVEFEGSAEAIRTIKEGVKDFDFTKIAPMPSNTLNISHGSINDAARGLFLYDAYKENIDELIVTLDKLPLFKKEGNRTQNANGVFTISYEPKFESIAFGNYDEKNPVESIEECHYCGDLLELARKTYASYEKSNADYAISRNVPKTHKSLLKRDMINTLIHAKPGIFNDNGKSEQLYVYLIEYAKNVAVQDIDPLLIVLIYNFFYDDISRALSSVKNYPKEGDSTWLGDESGDLSYMYDPDEVTGVSLSPKNQADLLAFGRIMYNNYVQYGAETWYEWHIDNWGTKWGAMEVNVQETETSLCYEFDTAWAMPIGIVNKLAPLISSTDASMLWKYADEDIGSNCGYVEKEKGKNSPCQFAEVNTVEFACEVWDYDPEDYMFDGDEEEDD